MSNQLKETNNQSNIDVKDYLYKVLAYWKLFLVTIVIGLIIAKFMNGYMQKIYSLNTVISVKEENNPLFSTGTNIAFNWGGASDELETVKVTLTSRTHNEIVVKRLQFYVEYLKEDRFRLADVYGYTPFKVALNIKKPQLYGKLISLEITGNDTYKISTEFNESGNNQVITYSSNTIENYSTNSLYYSEEFNVNDTIKSDFLNFKIDKIDTFTIGEKYFIRFGNFDGTVKGNKGLSVNTVTKAASLLILQKDGTNKNRIVDYLNTTVQVLDSIKQVQKIEYAVKTEAYIDTLFKEETKKLKEIEEGLGNYRESNNIFDLSTEGSTFYEETIQLEREKKNYKITTII
ncbi:hypothetical protein H9I45_01165 [Polaribacter haliotis]|uniref:Sugar transporter n=1 Tax=Polaribacter haliotis TaxID=1888915 RepID=A0A7L8AGJ0_9FLAO|nr:hypothetical protein [Polaribacter haliotis]QOD61080.1 hypothetical protein H9I45_01165 [Polaribacter haliotis]